MGRASIFTFNVAEIVEREVANKLGSVLYSRGSGETLDRYERSGRIM